MALAPRDIDGWPKMKMTRNGFTAERKIKTEWDNALGLARTLISGSDGFGQLFPYDPTTRARAMGTSIEKFGKSGVHADDAKLISYDHALVTVSYRTPQGGDERSSRGGGSSGEPEGGFIERFEPTADAEPLNHEEFVWKTPAAGGPVALKPEQAPVHVVVGMDYVLTRTRIRSLPARIFSLAGHINEDNFELYTFSWDFGPESLLYQAPDLQHTINPIDGADMFDATYRLSIKQVKLADGTWVGGWNYFFRPALKGWDRIALKTESGGIGADHNNFPKAVFGRL